MSTNNQKKSKDAIRLWSLSAKELLQELGSSEAGLSRAEAKRRLETYGTNEIAKSEKRYELEIFISQFQNPLVIMLLLAAGISHFLGEEIDAAVIVSIVFINSIFGFIQEYRAERALRELKKYVTLKTKVLRSGNVVEIDSREIVPGDIVHLNIGDIIPADTRLLNVEEMSADESSLTGESMPVVKEASAVDERYSLPQDIKNVAFMGTAVASGSGHGIVIATGRNTFFGKTAAYLKQTTHEGDFQKNIKKFSNFLLKIILLMTVFIFAANAVLEKGVLSSFIFAVALAVGITPEILPIVVTIALSNGALKMAKEKVITKRLVSVEDLGNIDTLCCDKTGTLTEGEISLLDYFDVDGQRDDKLLLYGLLCNSASAVKTRKISGNPIDKAIWKSEKAAKLKHELEGYELIDTNELDFERRRMSVVVKGKKGNILIVKGAPESIIKACTSATVKGDRRELSEELIVSITAKVAGYEGEGYRVIALAEKLTEKEETSKLDENELNLIGFMCFIDPPKKTVKESLRILQKLGVSIKIISGDSSLVTRKICYDVGLCSDVGKRGKAFLRGVGLTAEGNRIVTGEELEKLSDEEFKEYCVKYNVFARVTPEQKYKIVASLSGEGHIVGFLGDGINDVPALKAADVGISVDSATGIAKEAADIILLQKSLRVLAHGIIEGRKTFGNITKYILNTISANQGNMLTVALSSLFLPFIPLLPSQILLNNFMSDLPMLTISTDNVDEELLERPRRWNIKMISNFMIYFGLMSSFFDLLFIIPLIFFFNAGIGLFRTAWFLESVLSEILITFAIRTKQPFFRSMPSRWLLLTSLVVGVLAVFVVFTDFGGKYFAFFGIPIPILAFTAAILIAYLILTEVAKTYFFRRFEI